MQTRNSHRNNSNRITGKAHEMYEEFAATPREMKRDIRVLAYLLKGAFYVIAFQSLLITALVII